MYLAVLSRSLSNQNILRTQMELELDYVPIEFNLGSSLRNTSQLNLVIMGKSTLPPSVVHSIQLLPIFCHKTPHRYNFVNLVDDLNAVKGVDSNQNLSFNVFSCDSITELVFSLFDSH